VGKGSLWPFLVGIIFADSHEFDQKILGILPMFFQELAAGGAGYGETLGDGRTKGQ